MTSITKTFNGHALVFTPNQSGEFCLSAEQIGTALGYAEPRKAVMKILERNADEFTGLQGVVKMTTPGGMQDVTVIAEEGIYLVGMKATTKAAKEFRLWVVSVLRELRRGQLAPTVAAVSDVDRVAAGVVQLQQLYPVISGQVQAAQATADEAKATAERVEARQAITDPREIEARMVALHKIKSQLVDGTKGKPQPVTHPAFWSAIKRHCGVSSMQHRAALDVPMMDSAVAFARSWSFERGVQPPTLFDGDPA